MGRIGQWSSGYTARAGRKWRFGGMVRHAIETLEQRQLLSGAAEEGLLPPLNVESAALVQSLERTHTIPTVLVGKVAPELWSAVAKVSAGAVPASLSNALTRIDASGQFQVYIRTEGNVELKARELMTLGVEVELYNESLNTIQAWLPADLVDDVGRMTDVSRIDLPGYAVPRTGTIDSQGDAALRANEVRQRFAAYGVNGSGVSIGVISSGVPHLADARATGNLPANVIVDPYRPGDPDDDEGTAMLEIIHDLAPGAQLYFSGLDLEWSTSLQMIESMNWLVAQGVDVIVDDLGFFDEPFFEDGPVAQAAANAMAAGVVYVSAAGNQALDHYQANYLQGEWSGDGYWHNFGPEDIGQSVTIAPRSSFLAVLQWSDQFGASGNDYNLYLYRSDGIQLASSTVIQNGNDNPLEWVSINNDTDFWMNAFVAVNRRGGAATRYLELFTLGDAGQEYITPGDSIFGHPAVDAVIAVGAVNAQDPGWDTVANYSSQGSTTIYTNFVTQTFVQRNSLDGVAIDGVDTFVGTEGLWGPNRNPFFGTSAAAPHVAALAALVLQARPTTTPALVQSILTSTATDLAAYGTGYDAVSGYGLFDGLDAVYKAFTASVPDLTAVSDTGISSTDNVTLDTTPTFTGQAPTGSYVRLYVDGVERGSQQLGAGAWQYNITTGVLSNGAHTATIRVAADANTPLANLSYPSPGLAVTIDTVAPTVTITRSFASTISGPVSVDGTVTYAFSEAVGNFSLSDLALRHQNDVAIAMTPEGQGLSSSDGGVTWILSGLNSITAWAGEYYLWVLRAGFSDGAGNIISSDKSTTWFQNRISGDLGGAQDDTLRLVRDASIAQKFHVFINNTTGTPDYYVQAPSTNPIYVYGLDGADTITIDLTSGINTNNQIMCDAGTGVDSLTIIGTPGNDNITLTGSVVIFSKTISWSNTESVTLNGGDGDDVLTRTTQGSTPFVFNGGAGSDTLNLNSGSGTFTFNADAGIGSASLTVNVNSSAAVVFNATQHLAALNINGTGTATLSAGGSRVLVVNSLSIAKDAGGVYTGKLNLTDNDLIIRSDAANRQAVYNMVWAMIASGRAGTWQGNGMTSSSAQFNTYTSLGVMLNSSFSLFSGESVDSNCILVKYTWYGDADLSGFITGDDYFRTDMGYFGGLSGWSNGDYDYNGVIDGSDYYLIDLGYLGQTGPL